MDEMSAWNSFVNSGSVPDYLYYRAVKKANEGDDPPEDDADEVQDQGTDTPTTEYR